MQLKRSLVRQGGSSSLCKWKETFDSNRYCRCRWQAAFIFIYFGLSSQHEDERYCILCSVDSWLIDDRETSPRTEMEKSWQRGGFAHDDVLISFYHAIYSCPPQSKTEREENSHRNEKLNVYGNDDDDHHIVDSSTRVFVVDILHLTLRVFYRPSLKQAATVCEGFFSTAKNTIIARFPISKQKIAIFSRGNKIFPSRVVFYYFSWN